MTTQTSSQPTFSFEFFPPRTPEAVGKLQTTRDRLAKLKPDFFSVTFGAGGSTRDLTFETVQEIKRATGIEAAPHLSCIGTPLTTLREVLQKYKDAGIRHIVALRGDMGSGSMGWGELRYGNELVEFVRRETGEWFNIEVAAYPEVHPQAISAHEDLKNFKRKVDAGANGAITQYFFNPDAYFRFVDDCTRLGITIPITAGIMPITNFTQLMRFSEGCGAEIPRWIQKRMRDFGDDRASIRKFGIDVTTELCRRLLERGAPGLHIYSMNQHEPAEAIWKNLDLRAA
jgi:methylenetetrahydrofolate reductase (NADPH)